MSQNITTCKFVRSGVAIHAICLQMKFQSSIFGLREERTSTEGYYVFLCHWILYPEGVCFGVVMMWMAGWWELIIVVGSQNY